MGRAISIGVEAEWPDEESAAERERRQKCLEKLTWPSRAAAEAAAVYARWQYGGSPAAEAYCCKFCNKWHLARRGSGRT